MSRGRAAGGRRDRRGLARGHEGSRRPERRRPCSSLLGWRLRAQEKWAGWRALAGGEEERAAGVLGMVVVVVTAAAVAWWSQVQMEAGV